MSISKYELMRHSIFTKQIFINNPCAAHTVHCTPHKNVYFSRRESWIGFLAIIPSICSDRLWNMEDGALKLPKSIIQL